MSVYSANYIYEMQPLIQYATSTSNVAYMVTWRISVINTCTEQLLWQHHEYSDRFIDLQLPWAYKKAFLSNDGSKFITVGPDISRYDVSG